MGSGHGPVSGPPGAGPVVCAGPSYAGPSCARGPDSPVRGAGPACPGPGTADGAPVRRSQDSGTAGGARMRRSQDSGTAEGAPVRRSPHGPATRAPSHVPVRIPPTGSGRASERTAPESLCRARRAEPAALVQSQCAVCRDSARPGGPLKASRCTCPGNAPPGSRRRSSREVPPTEEVPQDILRCQEAPPKTLPDNRQLRPSKPFDGYVRVTVICVSCICPLDAQEPRYVDRSAIVRMMREPCEELM